MFDMEARHLLNLRVQNALRLHLSFLKSCMRLKLPQKVRCSQSWWVLMQNPRSAPAICEAMPKFLFWAPPAVYQDLIMCHVRPVQKVICQFVNWLKGNVKGTLGNCSWVHWEPRTRILVLLHRRSYITSATQTMFLCTVCNKEVLILWRCQRNWTVSFIAE